VRGAGPRRGGPFRTPDDRNRVDYRYVPTLRVSPMPLTISSCIVVAQAFPLT
jgi:hypothetical protein